MQAADPFVVAVAEAKVRARDASRGNKGLISASESNVSLRGPPYRRGIPAHMDGGTMTAHQYPLPQAVKPRGSIQANAAQLLLNMNPEAISRLQPLQKVAISRPLNDLLACWEGKNLG
jgi:hypothetical protein